MSRVVVLGCGYTGARVARLFAGAGWHAIGVTRSAESAREFAGERFEAVPCDISGTQAMAAMEGLQRAEAVVCAASSGRGGVEAYEAVYLNGVKNAIVCLQPKRLLFVSSTSVYAQNDGSIVTEENIAEPVSSTSQVLRTAEDLTLDYGGQVARLAGIYGPGRSVLLRKFLDGTARIEGDGTRHINQIHADDAAAAIFQLIAQSAAPGIYNVADDCPVTQRACYEWLAETLNMPLPPHGEIDPNRKRGVTDKRVSNAKLRATGWAPRYRSYREALALDAALLAGARGDGTGDARI